MKKDRISEVYTEFENSYKGKSKEEMDKVVSDLEKEIAGKEAVLESKEGEIRENISKDIEAKKKRLNNVKGYVKNKEQIEGIKKYKVTLETKLKTVLKTKTDSKKILDAAAKKLQNVEKKLNDEKYTTKLDNMQYNELIKQKANYTKDVETYSKQYCESRDREAELKAKISKCDLAWRTLFVNKDWDEIQRIATTDKQRFTRKITEEQEPISEKKKETPQKVAKSAMDKVQREISENVSKIMDEQKEEDKQEVKDLVPVKKENIFKRIWNKVKNFVSRKEEKAVQEPEEKPVNEEKTVNKERDAFLEGLRKHVDVEYREASKAEKIEQEKESHKAKANKTNEENEKEETER